MARAAFFRDGAKRGCRRVSQVALWPLVGAIYLIVAEAGPFGLEDIVGSSGYLGRDPHPAGHTAGLEPAHRAL